MWAYQADGGHRSKFDKTEHRLWSRVSSNGGTDGRLRIAHGHEVQVYRGLTASSRRRPGACQLARTYLSLVITTLDIVRSCCWRYEHRCS